MTNSEIQLKHFNFEPGYPPKDFYNWCLNNKLYKTDGGIEENSRMEMIYNGLEPFVGISAVVAYKENKPIALILCEHRDLKVEKSETENADLSFYNLGFVNIFVKKSQRKKGLATQLVQEMENLRLNLLKDKLPQDASTFFVAQQLAKVVVSEKAKYTYAIGSDIEHRGRQLEIDNIAYHKTNEAKSSFVAADNPLDNIKNLRLKHMLEFKVKPEIEWTGLKNIEILDKFIPPLKVTAKKKKM
jgi:Acetyltransferase (GNAT) family